MTSATTERRSAERTRTLPDVLGAGIVVAVLAAVWRSVIFAPGAITSGDLLQPFRLEALVARFVPFWNPILEFPNVETMDRLAWVAPFLPLGDPATIQSAMIAVAVVGAGLSMYAAARRLGAPVAVACLVALVYGCNPWIANRVQHLYILPGYAVLPLVAALWIRPPVRGSVPWMVALLTLGSTTPHTTVALWGTSVVLVGVRPSRAALRRMGAVAGWYALVNLYWLLPVLAFMAVADLVPSWPTWEQVESLSRQADVAAVVRLGGYWWPLAPVEVPAWLQPFGYALPAAFALAARPRDRHHGALLASALVCGVLAVGTALPWLVGPLVVDGPLADRAGWLLRDPNKAVGPLGAFALLAIAAATGAGGTGFLRGRRGHLAATGFLLVAYLAYAVPWVDGYVRGAYQAHSIPPALEEAAAWLEGRDGRAAWVPAYFGARTFWNGDQVTSDVPARSSPLPVLSPYDHDDRARRAFATLDFGAVLGDVPADLGALMRRWGVRWLVHHRDVLPARLQPSDAFDNRVEARPVTLARQGLPSAARFDGVTIHDAGIGTPAAEVLPHLSARPTAAAALLSNFGDAAAHVVATPEPHAGLARTLILPGDEPRLLTARDAVRVDLAGAAPNAEPGERWSRYGESDPGWWPALADRGGPPPSDADAVVTTSRAGAVLRTRARARPGPHRVWVRAYRGREAGAVRVAVGEEGLEEVLDLTARTPSMTWTDLGPVDLEAPVVGVRIENLVGSNVLADLRLVPEAAWRGAEERTADLVPLWAWPRPASCPTSGSAEDRPDVLTAGADLPWDGTIVDGGSWSEFDAIELDLRGTGVSRGVEVWTRVADVWLLLGTVHVGWEGWGTAVLPLVPSRFAFAPGGVANAATLLRVRPLREGDVLRLGEARLLREPECVLELRTREAGAFHLVAAGTGAPFPVSVAGVPHELDPDGRLRIRLNAGEHRLEFPTGIPGRVSAFALEPAHGGTAADGFGPQAARGASAACPDRWRLWRTNDRYVEGLRGFVAGQEARVVPVDGLLAGVWLPPGTCGPPILRNPWRSLGTTSLVASVLTSVALVGLSIVRRVP